MSKFFVPRMPNTRSGQQIRAAGELGSDLVPGSQISRITLGTGTTTTDVTFNAFTGGSTHTLSASLDAPSGSSATLTGSGLGPYTISPLVNSGDYIVMLQATDDTDGQIANAHIYVRVGDALTPPTSSELTITGGVIEWEAHPVVVDGATVGTPELTITSATEETV